jgi:hypothetical protein
LLQDVRHERTDSKEKATREGWSRQGAAWTAVMRVAPGYGLAGFAGVSVVATVGRGMEARETKRLR